MQRLPNYRVASFTGPGCAGNSHPVLFNPTPQRINDVAGGELSVCVYERASPPRVDFYQNRQRVLRCGSGTLAAARLLLNRQGRLPARLNTPAGSVALRQCGQQLGYCDQPLADCPGDPAFWAPCIGVAVVSVRLAGSARDYCIVELESAEAVAGASIHLDRVRSVTDRALILTAAPAPPWDYVLRYFAPHFSSGEDAATGSANLQLARYWQRRLGKREMTGRQLSPAGGLFRVQMEGPRVWVMGETKSTVGGLQSTE